MLINYRILSRIDTTIDSLTHQINYTARYNTRIHGQYDGTTLVQNPIQIQPRVVRCVFSCLQLYISNGGREMFSILGDAGSRWRRKAFNPRNILGDETQRYIFHLYSLIRSDVMCKGFSFSFQAYVSSDG